ncbi:zinc finger C4 type [Biomphalaria pfeifferi]|uniref:Zinc finger C4 type n=1 Tax=Biomphalaria pfeifferi TaxID=112525 RepID=A0AAD8EXM0_BIOPF|nr:zinc finger C4 type [Biomphalaria pfeifferi]
MQCFTRRHQSLIVSLRLDNGHNICVVCGEHSDQVSLHYARPLCNGCRAFFKRSVQGKVKFTGCKTGKNCKVNIESRKSCKSCRWDACVRAGVDVSKVQPSKENEQENGFNDSLNQSHLLFGSNFGMTTSWQTSRLALPSAAPTYLPLHVAYQSGLYPSHYHISLSSNHIADSHLVGGLSMHPRQLPYHGFISSSSASIPSWLWSSQKYVSQPGHQQTSQLGSLDSAFKPYNPGVTSALTDLSSSNINTRDVEQRTSTPNSHSIVPALESSPGTPNSHSIVPALESSPGTPNSHSIVPALESSPGTPNSHSIVPALESSPGTPNSHSIVPALESSPGTPNSHNFVPALESSPGTPNSHSFVPALESSPGTPNSNSFVPALESSPGIPKYSWTLRPNDKSDNSFTLGAHIDGNSSAGKEEKESTAYAQQLAELNSNQTEQPASSLLAAYQNYKIKNNDSPKTSLTHPGKSSEQSKNSKAFMISELLKDSDGDKISKNVDHYNQLTTTSINTPNGFSLMYQPKYFPMPHSFTPQTYFAQSVKESDRKYEAADMMLPVMSSTGHGFTLGGPFFPEQQKDNPPTSPPSPLDGLPGHYKSYEDVSSPELHVDCENITDDESSGTDHSSSSDGLPSQTYPNGLSLEGNAQVSECYTKRLESNNAVSFNYHESLPFDHERRQEAEVTDQQLKDNGDDSGIGASVTHLSATTNMTDTKENVSTSSPRATKRRVHSEPVLADMTPSKQQKLSVQSKRQGPGFTSTPITKKSK